MTEADILNRLIDYSALTLNGIGVFFTVISAYAAGLYYFINRAAFIGRLAAFVFFSVILVILSQVFLGASHVQAALVQSLANLAQQGALSPASTAVLANANATYVGLSTDDWIRGSMLIGLAVAYFALFYLTLLHNWRFDHFGRVIPSPEVTNDD